ncbi:MAG: hydrogenase maturation protease [Lentisphaerae bacterium]|nr:hydrogenase maturation protease [Lentisphaerota bacterium]
MKSNSKCRVWVAGLGNVLMSDDGVGAVAARILSEAPSADTVVSEVGTAIVFYTNLISDAESILCLDAVTSGKKPGTVTVFTLDDIEASGSQWRSAHELTLLDAIDVFRHGKRPNIKVIGVEPERIEYGLNLSETVKNAIPEVLALARKTILEMVSAA